MKLIKLTLISILVLFAIATGIGLLFPATVIVSRAVNINAPKDSIYALIKDLNGWKQWVNGMNENNVTIETPVKGQLGNSAVVIESNRQDTIRSIWTGRKGDTQLSYINLYHNNGQMETVVQWEFRQQLNWYPWERFGSMMNDKILGTMMEKNLNNLKELLERH